MDTSGHPAHDSEGYLSETARVAEVSKMMIGKVTKLGLGIEAVKTASDTFLLDPIEDNVIRAGGIALAGYAAYKSVDFIGHEVEEIVRNKDTGQQG